MNEVQIDVPDTQITQRLVDTLLNPVVPVVVEFGGDPNLVSRHSRIPNSLADLDFILIVQGGVDMAVSRLECVADRFPYFVSRGLPSS